MKTRNLIVFTASFALAICAGTLRADHFSGTSITYECIGVNQYRFSLDLYLDCAGVPVTTQSMSFSSDCGVSFTLAGLTAVSSVEVSPLCPSQTANSTCNGGAQPSFKRHRFQTTLFLSPCNKWTVEWYTCCRNTTQNVFLTPGTYVAATLNNLGGICDRSPRFVDSGVPYVCLNVPVAYNPGVTDADGDNLTFALISARYGAPAPTNVLYQGSYSGTQPFLGATINATTGQLLFTPTITGYYVVVIQVSSYNGLGQLIGTVMRDLMFAVIVCDGTPPASSGITSSSGGVWFQPFSVYACSGLNFCINVPFYDFQAANTVTVTTNASTVLPGATVTVTGTNPATAQICWTGNESILPQTVWFQASDGACPIPNTMSMSIIAVDCTTLPVELVSFTAEAEGKSVRTKWTTVSEQGSDLFTVERSPNGSMFEDLGSIDAAGHSQDVRNYTFIDSDPLHGTGYYRVREKDLDGTVSYSEVVAVHTQGDNLLQASNDGSTAWMVSGIPAGAQWELLDMQGRKMNEGVAQDDLVQLVQVPSASTAMHLLRVYAESGPMLLKLPPTVVGEHAAVSTPTR